MDNKEIIVVLDFIPYILLLRSLLLSYNIIYTKHSDITQEPCHKNLIKIQFISLAGEETCPVFRSERLKTPTLAWAALGVKQSSLWVCTVMIKAPVYVEAKC